MSKTNTFLKYYNKYFYTWDLFIEWWLIDYEWSVGDKTKGSALDAAVVLWFGDLVLKEGQNETWTTQ